MSDDEVERPTESLPQPPEPPAPVGPAFPAAGNTAPLFPAREPEPEAPFWTQPPASPPVWANPNPTIPLPDPAWTAHLPGPVPPGPVPPGPVPPGAVPPAAFPPGPVPAGSFPPGPVSPGWVPPPGPAAPRPLRRFGWIAGGAAVLLLAVLLAVLLAWRPWSGSPAAAPIQASPAPTAPAAGGPSSGDTAPRSEGAPPTSAAPPATSGAPGASGPSAAPSGPAGEWLAAQNAYCRNTVDPAIKAAAADPNSDAATFFTQMAAINRELDRRLRQAPPSSLKADVNRIADDWDKMAALDDQAAAAAQAGNRAEALRLANQGQVANQAGNDLAIKIGLPDCAAAGGIGDSNSPSPSQPFI